MARDCDRHMRSNEMIVTIMMLLVVVAVPMIMMLAYAGTLRQGR